MSLLGLKQFFYLGFYFINYGQFYIQGKIYNFCYSYELGFFGTLVESRIFYYIRFIFFGSKLVFY